MAPACDDAEPFGAMSCALYLVGETHAIPKTNSIVPAKEQKTIRLD